METKPRHILYEALLTRDKRYDGQLYFGVTSTGIYCRPVCPAPKPKPENILYFADAATAQLAGFRACKRCRPESRPGSPAWEGTGATISKALRLLATGGGPDSLAALSDTLGISDRHLRRLFKIHLGQSPMEVKMANRLGLAVSLLSDVETNIADIAFAAGFQSLRRFNDAFKTAYQMTPTAWREHHAP
jgi:AraC family transcriptional regulator, regulatory protein of adaptative response / methylated-DNA-[protein]-cysteine methyltransferase